MRNSIFAIGAVLLLSGCVHMPAGPGVAVMPAPGKPFDLFVNDEYTCRRFAEDQSGISPQQEADSSLATGAIGGAALGAAAGTAIGAVTGDVGAGAVIGAGTGLLGGTAAGSNAAYFNASTVQRRYDIAYEQCMYAKGNQIPGFPTVVGAPPMPPAMIPPPPPQVR